MAKVLMIQGTMSDAGKSLIVTGLCRIFSQDGYRVAPFKSQNMALNSYITREGLEMGRAQVVQAQAAGTEPVAAMNPILLKPSSDTGSQVVVMGKPVGQMNARDYYVYKKGLLPVIQQAFEQLDSQYDIVVIEGAGSPAEINLKQHDIVNMGMARLARAPVLLVGDIDRGGVFAQLYGTVMLLTPKERQMVKGLIINKFRGDVTLLEPGLEMLRKLCQIPIVGVAPYVKADIEPEDSLSLEGYKEQSEAVVDIAVIRFPRMSNFTDFQAFTALQGVRLRYVSRVNELGNPDMVILPGTKNTIDDLLWMRQNGLEAAVLKLADAQTMITGICGGYQMLGQSLCDSQGSESGKPVVLQGLGLLPMETRFFPEKKRTRVKGHLTVCEGILAPLCGLPIEGYEIHMGQSQMQQKITPLSLLSEYQSGGEGNKQEGAVFNHVFGTYIHGIFDAQGVAPTLVSLLAQKKGSQWKEQMDFDVNRYREQQFDLLARELRQHLNMEAIYQIMEEGIKE